MHRDASMYEAIPADTWSAVLRLVHTRSSRCGRTSPSTAGCAPSSSQFHVNSPQPPDSGSGGYLGAGTALWAAATGRRSTCCYRSGCRRSSRAALRRRSAPCSPHPPPRRPTRVAYVDVGGGRRQPTCSSIQVRGALRSWPTCVVALDARWRRIAPATARWSPRACTATSPCAPSASTSSSARSASDIRFDGLAGIDDRAWTRDPRRLLTGAGGGHGL